MKREWACDIIIPIWNQPERTRRCLESILHSTQEAVRLVLVDNASEAPTRGFLEQFEKSSPVPVEIIRNSENRGFIKAVNQGIRAAQSEWVCVLNNDTLAAPGWLTEMLQVAQSDPAIGLVNPTSNSLGFQPKEGLLGGYAQSLKSFSGRATELSTALGFCLLGRRSLFEKVGFLDESYGMGYFDDDDLSRKVKALGFRCVRACAAYVYHEERASFRLLPKRNEAFLQNRRLFEQRWGRRLRILWGLGGCSSSGPFSAETALFLVGEGHWLTFVDCQGALPSELLSHAQVSRLLSAPNRWRLKASLRLFLKRKKPFDLVISQDQNWSRWLNRFRRLYPAHLMDNPTPQEIVEKCKSLSRIPS